MAEENEGEKEFEELIEREYGETSDTPKLQTLTPDMMLKRLVWDIAPCVKAAEVSEKVGLHPASQDIEDAEHQESHLRVAQIAPILPFINFFSWQAAQVVRGSMMVGNDMSGPLTEDEVLPTEVLAPLLYQVALAVVAELADIGVVELPMIPRAMGFFAP